MQSTEQGLGERNTGRRQYIKGTNPLDGFSVKKKKGESDPNKQN